MTKPVINVADARFRDVIGADGAFAAKVASVGPAIGSAGLGCKLNSAVDDYDGEK